MNNEAFPAGGNGRWKSPVWLRVGYGPAEAVRSAAEGLGQLSHRWPAERGPHYAAAKAGCLAALYANGCCQTAREAFEKACIEARLTEAEDSFEMPGLRTVSYYTKEQPNAPQV
jgi:hypothetical protein